MVSRILPAAVWFAAMLLPAYSAMATTTALRSANECPPNAAACLGVKYLRKNPTEFVFRFVNSCEGRTLQFDWESCSHKACKLSRLSLGQGESKTLYNYRRPPGIHNLKCR